jgi:hypothetical protein
MSDATDVLHAVDQLRRDLSGYHGQLKAHNDLQRHCDNQRKRIVELEAIHARDKAENAKLRELVLDMMRFFEDGDYCTACEKVAECDAQEEYDDDCLMRGVFHARMRELGVEVDG